jgi:hypothetical protein
LGKVNSRQFVGEILITPVLTGATVSMKKKLADEGLVGGNLARRLDGYQGLVTEYNAAIKETLEEKSN